MRPIRWFCSGVWDVLRAFWHRMLEFVKGYLEIFGHGDVVGAYGIVPVNGESAKEGTGPVDGDGIQFLEGLDEVVGVSLTIYLTPKSSTTRKKMMGLVVYFQSAGVMGTEAKPNWAR